MLRTLRKKASKQVYDDSYMPVLHVKAEEIIVLITNIHRENLPPNEKHSRFHSTLKGKSHMLQKNVSLGIG